MLKASCYLSLRPYAGNAPACGDTGVIMATNDNCFVALVDVAGKGEEAAKIAEQARIYLQDNHGRGLLPLMQGLHTLLRGSRGAVAMLCRIEFASARLYCVGVGNIAARVIGPTPFPVRSQDGIIGYQMPLLQERAYQLAAGDVLFLHSDGVKEHVDMIQCRQILTGSAENPAAEIIARFGKREDDASCVVVRCSHA